jgi:plasmid maintenance system killer protein
MIQSFADADTEQLFLEERNRRFHAVARVALRKLISNALSLLSTGFLRGS